MNINSINTYSACNNYCCEPNKRENKKYMTHVCPESDLVSFRGNYGGFKSVFVDFEELFGQVKNLYGAISPKNIGDFFSSEDKFEKRED